MAESDKAGREILSSAADIKRLVGYLRASTRTGFLSLFKSTEFDDALEIPENEVVKKIELASEGGDLPKTIVWVRRSARLLRTHRISVSREAEFVQGSLLAEFAGRVAGGGHAPAGGGAQIGVDLYVAKSETTLTCWEDCTQYISSCLTSG